MSFYNTTSEKGNKLDRYNQAARHQSENVVWTFRQAKKGDINKLSASQVLAAYPTYFRTIFEHGERRRVELPKPLITSIRRSISTLTKAGVLEKTADKVDGPHGRPEYQYRMINDPGLRFVIVSKGDQISVRKINQIKTL